MTKPVYNSMLVESKLKGASCGTGKSLMFCFFQDGIRDFRL